MFRNYFAGFSSLMSFHIPNPICFPSKLFDKDNCIDGEKHLRLKLAVNEETTAFVRNLLLHKIVSRTI